MKWWNRQRTAFKALYITGALVILFCLLNSPAWRCGDYHICFIGPANRINLTGADGSNLLVQFNTFNADPEFTSTWRAYQVGYVGGDWNRQCLRVSHFSLPDQAIPQRISESGWCFDISGAWPVQGRWVATGVDDQTTTLWLAELSQSDESWKQVNGI